MSAAALTRNLVSVLNFRERLQLRRSAMFIETETRKESKLRRSDMPCLRTSRSYGA